MHTLISTNRKIKPTITKVPLYLIAVTRIFFTVLSISNCEDVSAMLLNVQVLSIFVPDDLYVYFKYHISNHNRNKISN